MRQMVCELCVVYEKMDIGKFIKVYDLPEHRWCSHCSTTTWCVLLQDADLLLLNGVKNLQKTTQTTEPHVTFNTTLDFIVYLYYFHLQNTKCKGKYIALILMNIQKSTTGIYFWVQIFLSDNQRKCTGERNLSVYRKQSNLSK